MDKSDIVEIYKSIKQSRGRREDVNIDNIKRKFIQTSDKKNGKHNNKERKNKEPESVFTDADFDNLFKN